MRMTAQKNACLDDAISTLATAGRNCKCPTAHVSRGTAIGHSLYGRMDYNTCIACAIEMLEQWNGHLSVAAIDAIEHGRGMVHREGRLLTIELPEHWGPL